MLEIPVFVFEREKHESLGGAAMRLHGAGGRHEAGPGRARMERQPSRSHLERHGRLSVRRGANDATPSLPEPDAPRPHERLHEPDVEWQQSQVVTIGLKCAVIRE